MKLSTVSKALDRSIKIPTSTNYIITLKYLKFYQYSDEYDKNQPKLVRLILHNHHIIIYT